MKKPTDKQLLKIATEFRKGMLGKDSSRGYCGMVCFALQGYLNAMGIKTTLYEGDWGEGNHIWMVLEDGRVLDPTIDQYNYITPKYPMVHLGEPLDAHQGGHLYRNQAA
jgi:hypothetical protein